MPGEDADKEGKKKYKVEFKQIYLSKPMVTEADGMTSTLFPKEARLRNLTYSAPLYCDIEFTKWRVEHDEEIKRQRYEEDPKANVDNEVDGSRLKISQEFIGDVPIMLRSQRCNLSGAGDGALTDKELTELGECQPLLHQRTTRRSRVCR